MQKWEQRQTTVVETIEQFGHEWSQVKQQQSQAPKHLPWAELPEETKFERLAPSRKRLLDTVKMLAYRAGAAAGLILPSGRDLQPDESQGQLEVRLPPCSNPRSNRAIAYRMEQLNAAEMQYPGTKLTLTYTLIGTSQD